ncbi:xaa-Pro aminopeptidase [Tremella mesenterica]|uniref:Xaa-Pro aminopeptidase n=1 Tax=Tremella mesenterica TaxID=5217 RepID=A0A4Q1BJ72_TREME|nr:xaa-Pro aminopeptidase [Tremella mesenterica]
MTELDSLGKLRALRELMRERQLDVYIVPTEDAHSSEYIAPCDARRTYITSFTGSAGCAVITQDRALCWTDGRYFLQAEKQLGQGWSLMKQGMPDVLPWNQWLKQHASSSKIGIDPTLISCSEAMSLTTLLSAHTSRSSLFPVQENLIDVLWYSRPPRPANPVFRLEERFTGEALGQKLRSLREKLAKTGSPGMIVSQLDEVAWLFNLRGSDIPYNPVFFAYVILTPEECTLFIQPSSISETIREYLHANDVAVLDYEQLWSDGKEKQILGRALTQEESREEGLVKTDKVLIGGKTSWAAARAVGESNVEVQKSMIELAKSKKNATEIEGFRHCHIRDGAALVRYFAWLEETLHRGEKLTEYHAAQRLEEYRKENQWFMGLSFETISSTGSNAAVIHYAPSMENSAIMDVDQIYLCDSGAQYLDGTTDTTRTLHFGTPTDEERRAFTRVLQGHIAMDTMVFPQGTTGYIIDAIARRPLWSDGLDYRHSTGHGVGAFLNVHEGPQGIGLRPAYNDHPLLAGNVISNEPGYYADGKFGIRIENVMIVKPSDTRNNFGGKGYLEFERVTMCPIQTKLIQHHLLLEWERKWINEYHNEVLEKLTPLLEQFDDSRALAWLRRECQDI